MWEVAHGRGGFLQLSPSLKVHRAECYLLMALQTARAAILFRRVIWVTELTVPCSPRWGFSYLQSNHHLHQHHPKGADSWAPTPNLMNRSLQGRSLSTHFLSFVGDFGPRRRLRIAIQWEKKRNMLPNQVGTWKREFPNMANSNNVQCNLQSKSLPKINSPLSSSSRQIFLCELDALSVAGHPSRMSAHRHLQGHRASNRSARAWQAWWGEGWFIAPTRSTGPFMPVFSRNFVTSEEPIC